tara:strand:- start:178 stop:1032 length:855 start_codon:yes stop_codon:yes gene_type:complete
MFAFITCIRHPDSTQNWQHVETLYEQCARSICNQADEDFILIVVCNKKPEINFHDEHIIYVETDLPIPRKERRYVVMDRAIKRLIGIKVAQQHQADWLMVVDADDYVSNKLVKNIQSAVLDNSSAGYYINKGYLYDYQTHRVQRKYGFNTYCGSSLIYQAKHIYPLLDLAHEDWNQLIQSNEANIEVLMDLFGNHIRSRKYFENQSKPLTEYPYFGAAWVINNGENTSKTKGKNSGIFPNHALAKEYKFPQSAGKRENNLKSVIHEKFLLLKSLVAFRLNISKH